MPSLVEISIPSTTESTSATKSYTVYNISIRLPLRSFVIQKRYSEFLSFHQRLLSQVNNKPPPVPFPSKAWFKHTVSNSSYREERRKSLEAYIQAINSSDDETWRTSSAWRTFLNLPSGLTLWTTSSSSTTRDERATSTSSGARIASLHSAITGPSRTSLNQSGGSGYESSSEPITDPTIWLDCFRECKTHLHDARSCLTRWDQEFSMSTQREYSAKAKSNLHKAEKMLAVLDEGLRSLTARKRWGSALSSASPARRVASSPTPGSLGDGEMRRRKDLVGAAKKEKDGLQNLLQNMTLKSASTNTANHYPERHSEGLFGGAGASSPLTSRNGGRVVGEETEETRELDNEGVLSLQKEYMEEQDISVEELRKIIARQKELGIAINSELGLQNEMLGMVDDDVTRLSRKVETGRKRVKDIS